MIVANICISDIPATKRRESNGKVYISVVIDERRSPDNYGNTHSVSVSQSKEEREKREKKIYVGSGKEYRFGGQQSSKDDLPVDERPKRDMPW